MYLQSMRYENFRGIKDLEIQLNKNLNVIVGINGAGKTSMLDGCGIILSKLQSKILGRKNDYELQYLDIMSGSKLCSLEPEFYFSDKCYSKIKISKSHTISNKKDDLEIFDNIVHKIKEELDRNSSNIPPFIYYRAHRAVLDIPLKSRKKYKSDILSEYDKSLDGNTNFQLFFEWFREQEDLENEHKVAINDLISDEQFKSKINQAEKSLQVMEQVLKLFNELPTEFVNFNKDSNDVQELDSLRDEVVDLKKEISQVKEIIDSANLHAESINHKKLLFVKKALEIFLPNIKDLHIQRESLAMVAYKYNKLLRLEQLSQGEKIYIAMIGDLARRLTIANPLLDNPLEGIGIVLIDEVELHLHPKWQGEIINKLVNIFPNCQFILTTHSPQIIREVKKESIFLLSVNDNGDVNISKPHRTIGLDSSDVLSEIMDAPTLNEEFSRKISEVRSLIETENLNIARKKLDELEKEFLDVPEIIRARSFLEFMED